jgi:RimJ/RimL family protein N-acetyltransferase
MLEGRLVRLRAIERDDLESIWRLRNDLEVEAAVSAEPPTPVSLEEVTADWEKGNEEGIDGARFAIEVDGEVIGRADLFALDEYARSIQLGISIATEHQGKGYGKEAVALLVGYAFTHLNVHRVWLDVVADNEPAIRAYRAAGFVEEGRLRDHFWHHGRHKDAIVMGILKPDWEARSDAAAG